MNESLDLLKNWLERKQASSQFTVPMDARPSHIKAISTEDAFHPDFLRGLYVLEQAMLEKGLQPADFTISKHRARLSGYYPGTSNPNFILYEYTVSFHSHSYSVRRESDMEFLAYFSTLCLSEEKEGDSPSEVIAGLEDIVDSFYQKLIHWLKADAI